MDDRHDGQFIEGDDAERESPQPTEPPLSQRNRPAWLGLIFGLFACVPGVGVVALGLGVVGLSKARQPGVRGRPIAMCAVILGILGVFWSAMLLGAYLQARANKQAAPFQSATRQFIMLVGSGQVGPAKGMCASSIDQTTLTQTAEQFEALGAITGDIDPNEMVDIRDPNNVMIYARLVFAKAPKVMQTHWKLVNNVPQLQSYELVDAPLRKSDGLK